MSRTVFLLVWGLVRIFVLYGRVIRGGFGKAVYIWRSVLPYSNAVISDNRKTEIKEIRLTSVGGTNYDLPPMRK